MKIEIVEKHDIWDKWLQEQQNVRIFYRSSFYRAYNRPFIMAKLYKGNEVVAGWIFSYEGKKILRPPLVPYTGLFYCLNSEIKNYRYNTTIQEINAYFCKYLTEKFDEISLRLSPDIQDIQQFIWAGFTIHPRYTYVLSISSIDKAKEELNVSMRRNIKKNYNKYILEIDNNVSNYLNMIKATKSNKILYLDYAKKIDEFLSTYKNGACFVQRTQQNKVISASFIVWDKLTGYYLAGGYDNQFGDEHASEIALWKAIEYCSSLGIKEFDFEGSMIPGVEEFFRKFGGDKRLYFHIIKKKKTSTIKTILRNVKKRLSL